MIASYKFILTRVLLFFSVCLLTSSSFAQHMHTMISTNIVINKTKNIINRIKPTKPKPPYGLGGP